MPLGFQSQGSLRQIDARAFKERCQSANSKTTACSFCRVALGHAGLAREQLARQSELQSKADQGRANLFKVSTKGADHIVRFVT